MLTCTYHSFVFSALKQPNQKLEHFLLFLFQLNYFQNVYATCKEAESIIKIISRAAATIMMTSASSASQKIVQTSFACFATLSFIIISGKKKRVAEHNEA